MKNWKKYRLVDVCERITVGYVGSMASEYVEEGIPFLRSLNIKPYRLDTTDIKYITTSFNDKITKSALYPEDVVVVRTGIPGTCCVIPDSFENLNCSDLVVITTKQRELNPHFLCFYFNTIAKSYVQSQKVGAIQQHFNVGSAKEMEIYLPPIEEQYRISKILSNLNTKITLNNRINQELEAMAKLIYDYWFVQFDFPMSEAQAKALGKSELAGKPYKASGGKMVYNEQLKREIPEGWGVKELRDLVDCNYRNINKNDDFGFIKYLDTSNLTDNYIDELQYLEPSGKWPSRAQRVLEVGNILYSTVRPKQRHHGLLKSVEENMISSTGFAQLRSRNKEIKPDILYTFLRSDWVTTRLNQIAELAVTSYPSISPDDILDLKLPLPTLDSKILELLGNNLDSIHKKINLNQKQNQKLAELRDWLLPMLMNGQVSIRQAQDKVREAEERVEEIS